MRRAGDRRVAVEIGLLNRAITTIDALALTESPPGGAEGGSNSLRSWTRSQRIRTAAAISVTAPILDAGLVPVYLEIGEKAAHLRELGMSDRAIARAIGVSDKTVTKSLRKPVSPKYRE